MENKISIIYDKGKPVNIKIGEFILDKYEALAICIRLDKGNQNAMKFTEYIRNIFYDDPIFKDISETVYRFLILKEMNIDNEFAVQRYFNGNVKNILGEEYDYIELPKESIIKGHYPDSWIKYNDDLFPVEVKKNNFNDKALKQLTRYIDIYQSKKGIAVGEKLTVKGNLPSNIIFISSEGWELFY